MSGQGENSPDSISEKPSEPSVYTGSNLGQWIENVLEAQRRVERVLNYGIIRDAIEAQKRIDRTFTPARVQGLIEAQERAERVLNSRLIQDAVETQRWVERTYTPERIQRLVEVQKRVEQAIDPMVFQWCIEMQEILESTLIQLNSPSISNTVSTISTTNHSRWGSAVSQKREIDEHPPIDVDEIRSPETRIHDKLIWDDGEWYRERVREIAYCITDYVFWQAKNAGELTDASEHEISVGMFVATCIITIALTGNPITSLVTGSALSGATFRMEKAAVDRNERKNLDERFG